MPAGWAPGGVRIGTRVVRWFLSARIRLTMRTVSAVATVLLPVLAIAGPGAESSFQGRRALIIGIDGLRSDALKSAVDSGAAPHIAELIAHGTVTWSAYAGGRGGEDPTTQPTVSGPGWSSVLTGTWTDKHGVVDNSFAHNHLDQWPHFFSHLKKAAPEAITASSVDWPEIHEHILASAGEHAADHACCLASYTPADDAELARQTAAWLEDENPDVIFFYQGRVDGAGHEHGFSPESEGYMEAIAQTDSNIGVVLEAIAARPRTEDWLVVLTTDHGGIGKGHGGQSPEERTIPLVVSGGAVAKGETSSASPGQTAVPATVFAHLGLAVDPAWGWEDPAFAVPANSAESTAVAAADPAAATVPAAPVQP